METNNEICIGNPLAGFYKKETLVLNRFNNSYIFLSSYWKKCSLMHIWSLNLSSNLSIKFSDHFYSSYSSLHDYYCIDNKFYNADKVSLSRITLFHWYLVHFFKNIYSPVFTILLLYSWILNKCSYGLLNPSP